VPEQVDIYIPSRRSTTEETEKGAVDHGPGSYVPVSLDWGSLLSGGSSEPAWFAHKTAVRETTGGWEAEVRNRGSHEATGVTVEAWWHAWPSQRPPPLWNSGSWTSGGKKGPVKVLAGGSQVLGPFSPVSGSGRHLLFITATCTGDGANTDSPARACSYLQTALEELVPTDNNLALALVTLS